MLFERQPVEDREKNIEESPIAPVSNVGDPHKTL